MASKAVYQTIRFKYRKPTLEEQMRMEQQATRSTKTESKVQKRQRELGRNLRNDEIPFKTARLVDPTTNQLGPEIDVPNLLNEIKYDRTKDEHGKERRKWQIVELVAEEPEPIVKLVDTRQAYRKTKEHAEQAKKLEEKEVQMSWSIAGGDLVHKSKKVREALEQGHKVNVVFAVKKGQAPIQPSQIPERLQQFMDLVSDIGQELKPPLIQGGTAVVYLKSTKPSD
ncbi:hypothetical protein EIP86_010331 [Pleurotus ostreatoroseus]|nr:hypothetical protein EIP86_010331 [Pleurotus ostreatoroseus]